MFDVGLNRLNRMSLPDVLRFLGTCCGSSTWCFKMAKGRPYPTSEELLRFSDLMFGALMKEDWLEAFAHHTPIGQKLVSRGGLPDEDQAELEDSCRLYRRRFGYTFVMDDRDMEVHQILVELRRRLSHNAYDELYTAAGQQKRITSGKLAATLETWNRNFAAAMEGQPSDLDAEIPQTRVIERHPPSELTKKSA